MKFFICVTCMKLAFPEHLGLRTSSIIAESTLKQRIEILSMCIEKGQLQKQSQLVFHNVNLPKVKKDSHKSGMNNSQFLSLLDIKYKPPNLTLLCICSIFKIFYGSQLWIQNKCFHFPYHDLSHLKQRSISFIKFEQEGIWFFSKTTAL